MPLLMMNRDEKDIEQIAEHEASIVQLNKDLSYYKQELIDARARKSASDDELGTVKGKLETMQNSITSLSNEGKTNMQQASY